MKGDMTGINLDQTFCHTAHVHSQSLSPHVIGIPNCSIGSMVGLPMKTQFCTTWIQNTWLFRTQQNQSIQVVPGWPGGGSFRGKRTTPKKKFASTTKYHSVLESITSYCKVFLSTTPYYKVWHQLHQILRLPKWLWWLILITHETHWNVQHNARSNRSHPPTSSNIIAAATNFRVQDLSKKSVTRSCNGRFDQLLRRAYLSHLGEAFCLEKYNFRAPAISLQHYQILRLPPKRTLMIDRRHSWNVQNARSISPVQCADLFYWSLLYSTLLYSSLLYSSLLFSSLLFSTTLFSSLLLSILYCSLLKSTLLYSTILSHV